MSSCVTLNLRRGRAKPLHAGHPWVFADAVAGFNGPKPGAGDEVRVVDESNFVFGHGYYSPDSAIAVRLLTRGDDPADEGCLTSKLSAALALRRETLGLGVRTEAPQPAASSVPSGGAAAASGAASTGAPAPRATTAYRLVHSEGDGLGGLTVDVYGDYLCVQFGTAGMDRRRETILDLLVERLKPRGILDRSDARMRQIEKLPPAPTTAVRGDAPDGPFEVLEDGLALQVDIRPGKGQKTGLYLDQRENRRRFGALASGRDVLDCFAYTGAFSIHAARGGARSLALVESSEGALTAARDNLARNGVEDADLVCMDWVEGFRVLRGKHRQFDLVVLDPPKFARDQASVTRALCGYRDLNGQAARLIRPGGLLFTCSCSGNVGEIEFERAVAAGLHQAGRRAAVIERRGAGPDHPSPPGFEQGRYLKVLILRVE